jgi:hypothetical protein
MIRLFNWFRRGSLERGLDRELQYHFDRRVADLIAAGIPEAEARRRVAAELGSAQVREEVRDVWLTRWFRDFLYDLRFSARSFLRSPGFTAVTLLSLALGIGATTAIYSLVDQVILHALPVREPERLVLVDWNGDDLITYATGSLNLMPYPICRDGATFYIKVHGAPEQAIPSIRRLVRQDDPRLPILWFRTLDDQVNRSLSTERLLAALSGSFGALALILSLIGLYGVMSFVVTRRTREIGIRLALGATRASALRLVLRDAVTMIAAGVALALPCVAALGKLVQSQLFGVTATDPATIAAAALVLAAGALAAAFMPAWRASNVSPTDALRLE